MAGINQYKDYSEIKKIVSKIENLELAYDSSTQKLQIFKGTYSGEIQTLLTNLRTDLPPQFIAKEKQLPNQITEITILPQ
ncbi:MAG: hypothetical protein IPJ69_06160 [Deltaproteobacteria bacterium]|nr:MAG: hypothetical protein IPJ69_06160 [Deltaproteobacteria bacterium]